jgi:GntR family transcriptional repressor for pyruvate dehydrogenase complex
LIQRETAVDVCAKMLREAIVEGELSPDEKLLPERELARQLGVNRVTIRSALAQLAAGRLLEVRQGSGHRVRDYRRVGGPDLIPFLVRAPGAKPRAGNVRFIVRDLLLVRRMLLGLAIDRAAEEASRVDRKRLQDAVSDLHDGEGETLRALERIVIDTLLDATKSVVLPLALNPFLSIMDRIPALDAALTREAHGGLAAWEALARGLEQDSPHALEEAKEELARHDLMVLSQLPRR